MSKHELKRWLREVYARLLFHTGLHRLVDRLMPRRLTILAGHCLGETEGNRHLPPDMRISPAALERILRWFQGRYALCTVSEGLERVSGSGSPRGLLALSMDDGYLDNRTELLPFLRRLGAPATVYLETRVLDERRLGWSHMLFWILDRTSPEDFLERFSARCADAPTVAKLDRVAAAGERPGYQLKRILKYEADEVERDRAVESVFRELGGDERALCGELFMTWEQARELASAGIELGGHTVGHPVLARLPAEAQRAEIGGCYGRLESELGRPAATFAYPFGRRWDYDQGSREAAAGAGFRYGLSSHGGTNDGGSEPFDLRRVTIDDGARLHLLVAEACGGFDLARRFGLDFSD